MMNFFNCNNFTFSAGMYNWFMPNWSFSNFFPQFQMPSFNVFNNWFDSFNFNYTPYIPQMSPLFANQINYDYYANIFDSGNKIKKKDVTDKSTNTDTFTKSNNTKLTGYNAEKGKRLASVALDNSVGWRGYCAAYVKDSIQDANLGIYKYGHAYQMPSILRNNSNFKEISPEGVDVSKLPAGCVLVYDRGVQGYSKKYGHTEITTGDGRAVSDGITKNLYKKPSTIFIPV